MAFCTALNYREQIYLLLVSDHGMRFIQHDQIVWMDDLIQEKTSHEWIGTLGSYAACI